MDERPCTNGLNSKELFQRALEHYRSGERSEAERLSEGICEGDPNYAPAWHLLGMIAYRKGEYNAAIERMGRAVALSPQTAFFHNDLGNVFLDKGDVNESIACYRNVLTRDPKAVRTYCRLAVALKKKGLADEALKSLAIALKLKPDEPDALYQAGFIFSEKGMPNEAIACFEKLIDVSPNRENTLFALGVAYGQVDRYREALDCYRRVLALNPGHARAWSNLGLLLKEEGLIAEAIEAYQKAIQISPDLCGAHWNLSHALLLRGEFEKGWKEFEWRLQKDDWAKANSRHCTAPVWGGQSFSGKTLLVHDEQGLGDAIQFIRYLPMVKERGGHVIFETQDTLAGILRDLPGMDQLVVQSKEGALPDPIDYYVPLLSLPAIFNTSLDTIPHTVPYLHADPEKAQYWRERLEHLEQKMFNVGIAWAGSPKHPNDRNRSCPLAFFEPLSKIKGVRLVGIQQGKAAEQVNQLPAGMSLLNLGPKLQDFSDTMGLIENLDLVISVDTAVAHLAGAMGKPVWILLPFSPDWRWLLDHPNTPWYPTMRVSRQKERGDWSSVFKEVQQELEKELSKGADGAQSDSRSQMQVNVFQKYRPAAMVVSHERSGTHFLMNSLASCYGYVSNPWIDIDYHQFNTNFYSGESMANLVRKICAYPVSNVIKDHHQAAFYECLLRDLPRGLRIFYIYRNPAKTLLSFWRLIHRLDWCEGPKTLDPEEFVKAEPCGYCLRYQMNQVPTMARRWAIHVEGWLEAASRSDCIIPVRYEDLDENYEATMASLSPALESGMNGRVRPDRNYNIISGGVNKPGEAKVDETAVHEICLELASDTMKRLGYA